MASKRTAHAGLAELDERIAEARQAERDAELQRHAAESEVEHARDAVREAHDLNANPTKPTARLEQAKHDAEQAALASEGVARRVRRLTGERERYLAENGGKLLGELQPACDEAVQELQAAADALLAAHAKWQHTAGQVAGYLRGMNLSPAENQPGEHGLEPVLRDLKRVGDLRSPAPHWRRREATEGEQRRVAQLLSQRNENNGNNWIEAA